MNFNKYNFETLAQFQEVQEVAKQNGLETMQEFLSFLSANYSHLKK